MPRLLTLVSLFALVAAAQAQPQAPPRFEVVSVKSAAGCEFRGGGGQQSHSGAIHWDCEPVNGMIQWAFGTFADGVSPRSQTVRMIGLPAWAENDRFLIDAKAPGASYAQMAGPMMRALLEDRFALKTHTESRTVPVYVLSASGPTKLQPAREGGCVMPDPDHFPIDPGVHLCGDRTLHRAPGKTSVDYYGATMLDLARFLTLNLDRSVIDRTDLTGRYDFHLDFAPEEDLSRPSQSAPGAPPILSALSGLGLKLTATNAAVEFLIIDHVEKPSEN